MYAFTDDYKTDLHAHITQLFTQAKSLNTAREERLQDADDLIEAYYAHCEQVPDGIALERLATLILRDELTDATPYKTKNTEYPIESDRQELDYYNGLTMRKVPDTIGMDGNDHRLPTRKHF